MFHENNGSSESDEPARQVPMEDSVASLISSIHAFRSKGLEQSRQGPKKHVDVLICEVHIWKVPLSIAQGTL